MQELAMDRSLDGLKIEELKMSDFVSDSSGGESVSKLVSAACSASVSTCSCFVA